MGNNTTPGFPEIMVLEAAYRAEEGAEVEAGPRRHMVAYMYPEDYDLQEHLMNTDVAKALGGEWLDAAAPVA